MGSMGLSKVWAGLSLHAKSCWNFFEPFGVWGLGVFRVFRAVSGLCRGLGFIGV